MDWRRLYSVDSDTGGKAWGFLTPGAAILYKTKISSDRIFKSQYLVKS